MAGREMALQASTFKHHDAGSLDPRRYGAYTLGKIQRSVELEVPISVFKLNFTRSVIDGLAG